MSWNIFKQISFINKVKKAIKQTKKMLDTNKDLTNQVKRIIGNLKTDIEALLTYLPHLKPIYKEIVEIVKQVF